MPIRKSVRSFFRRGRNREHQLENQGSATVAGEGQTDTYSSMSSIPHITDADTTAEQSVRPDQAVDQAVDADVTIDPPDPAAPVLSQNAEQMPSSTPAPSAPQDMAALSQQTGLHSQAPTAKPKVKTPAEQLQELFQEALDQYANRTKTNLRENPLATRLSSCDSVEAVTTILNEHISAFDEFREGGAGVQLMRRLKPIVSSLLALHLNETVGEGVGVVFGPAKAIIGAVGVLLEAIKGVSDSYDALLELFECVESFLCRLEVYTKITLSPATKSIVVKTLVKLISIFGLATEQVTSGRFRKYVKTLLGDTTIENALRRLNTLTTLEAQTNASESLGLIHGLVETFKSLMMNQVLSTLSIREDLFELKESLAETERNKMIEKYRGWLLPPNPSSNHNTAVRSHHEGTAVWFIEGKIMRDWMTNGSLMWINGKPGSGKTVLCSSIIEDIKRRCLLDPRSILAYFYCDFRDPAKQDVDGLLLHQLIRFASCSNICLTILSNLYSMHNQGSERPTDECLMRCLKEMLQALADHPVYIIIDALDECPNSGIPTPRKRMLTLAGDLITMHLPNLHICITSRPERDIAAVLKPLASQCIGIDAEDGQARDIARYVCAAVESDSGYELWEGEEKALVIKELSAKANGMFRWAYCQLDVLRNCLSIRQALQDLPETLDETYMRILERLNRHNWKLTHRLLQCLTVCVRPLTAEELVEILSVDIDSGGIPQLKTDWRRSNPELHIHILCSALVEINPDTKRVQFAHFSVQEYLLSSRLATEQEASLRQFHIVSRDAHAVIARVCLGVLLGLQVSNDDQDTTVSAEWASSLSVYSAEHWVVHAQFEDVANGIQEAMQYLFDPSYQYIEAWNQIYEANSLFNELRGGALYCAARYGFIDVVAHILHHCTGTGANIDIQGGDYGSALGAASREGHLDIVRLLIENGANINIQGGKYGSAVGVASYWGHLEAVRLLIENGADINIQGGEFGSALGAASYRGHPEAVRLLIENGADINIQGGEFGSALGAASYRGHLDIVRLLIEGGANINIQGGPYGSALGAASYTGRLDIVRLLIAKGADINIQGGEYGSALGAASYRGHLEIVRMLIDNDADINIRGGNYGSALGSASIRGRLEIVRMLMDNGADINIQGGKYGSALGAASSSGHLDIVRMLMDNGADINIQGGEYGSALGAASYWGDLEIVRMLMDNGADINIQGSEYGSALGAASASYKEDPEIVRLLIDNGADINIQGGEYGSALIAASHKGHLEIVRLLIENGADINIQGGDYGSALGAASYEGHLEIVRMLIELGADVNALAREYGTALHMAAYKGELEVVRTLIEHGADVNAQGNKYRSVLGATESQDVPDWWLYSEYSIRRDEWLKGRQEVAALLRRHGAQ